MSWFSRPLSWFWPDERSAIASAASPSTSVDAERESLSDRAALSLGSPSDVNVSVGSATSVQGSVQPQCTIQSCAEHLKGLYIASREAAQLDTAVSSTQACGKVSFHLCALGPDEVRSRCKQGFEGSLAQIERKEVLQQQLNLQSAATDDVDLDSLFRPTLSRPENDSNSTCSKEGTWSNASSVLAISGPEAGSQSFFQDAVLDKWSQDTLWTQLDVVVCQSLLSDSVRSASNVYELFGTNELGWDSRGKGGVFSDFLASHPENVCLILSGLDAVGLEACSDYVRGVLCSGTLQNVRLIVVSRCCRDVIMLVESGSFDCFAQVVGQYKPPGSSVIAVESGGCIADDAPARALSNVIGRSPHLAGLACDAFCLRRIAEEYQRAKVAPACLSSICVAQVLHTVSSHWKLEICDWTSMPASAADLLVHIGFFAFHMLVRRQFSFTSCHLAEWSLGEKALSLGLIVPQRALASDQRVWCFRHQAIQEYLAVKFVTSCQLNEGSIAWLVSHLGPISTHLSTFWILLAADLNSELFADKLVQLVIDEFAADGSSDVPCCSDVQFLSDSKFLEAIAPITEALSSKSTGEVASMLLDVSPQAHADVHLQPAGLGDASRPDAHHHRVLVQWRRSTLNAGVDVLLARLNTAVIRADLCLKSPTAAGDDLSADRWKCSTKSEHEYARQCLAHRCFSERCRLAETGTSNLRPVARMSCLVTGRHVSTIGFSCYSPTPADCRALSYVVQFHADAVRNVLFRWSRLGAKQLSLMLPALTSCSQLVQIDLLDNGLSADTVHYLCSLLSSNQSTLRMFYFRSNPIGDTGLLAMQTALQSCKLLGALFLSGCQLHSPSTPAIAQVLLACPDLCRFELSSSDVGDDGLATLAPQLARRKLVYLLLRESGLSGGCAPALSAVLHSQDQLTRLDLSENALGDAGLEGVRVALCTCTGLVVVQLASMHLTSQALPILSDLLGHWSGLRELRVHGTNDFSGADQSMEDCFVTRVQEHSHLSTLWLPDIAKTAPSFHKKIRALDGDKLDVGFTA